MDIVPPCRLLWTSWRWEVEWCYHCMLNPARHSNVMIHHLHHLHHLHLWSQNISQCWAGWCWSHHTYRGTLFMQERGRRSFRPVDWGKVLVHHQTVLMTASRQCSGTTVVVGWPGWDWMNITVITISFCQSDPSQSVRSDQCQPGGGGARNYQELFWQTLLAAL